MKKSDEMDSAISTILNRQSGREAYEQQTWIVQVAKLIHSWRTDANLTQKQLAEAINTRQSAISKLESYDNDNMPSVSTLIAIAHACNRTFILGSRPGQNKVVADSKVSAEEAELVAM